MARRRDRLPPQRAPRPAHGALMEGARCIGASVEAADAAQPCPIRALPEGALLDVFAQLPAVARTRCGAVCRAWRASLRDPRAWTRCVLSPQDGVDYCTDAVLRAVSARARGALKVLDVSGCCSLTHAALLSVAAANAGALQELRGVGRVRAVKDEEFWVEFSSDTRCFAVKELLRAAPLLRVLDVAVDSRLRDLPTLLRSETPNQSLVIRELLIANEEELDHLDDAALLAISSDMTAHATLSAVHVHNLGGARLVGSITRLEAFADFALARCLNRVSLIGCGLHTNTECGAALARLVSGGTLSSLCMAHDFMSYLLVPESGISLPSPLLTALRESTTLTHLSLVNIGLFHATHMRCCPALVVLQALTAHPTMASLDLSSDHMDDDSCCVELLDVVHAFVAANSPALTRFTLENVEIGNETACALFSALPLNTHLRVLHCYNKDHHQPTASFFRATALPAVRLNMSLNELLCYDTMHHGDKPAEALVARRNATARAGRPAMLVRSATALSLLPRSVVARIFSLVPVDVRLRCLEVCHTWNVLLRFNPAVWAWLDFSPAGGVVRPNDTMLTTSVAHASYKVGLLDVSGCTKFISWEAILYMCTRHWHEEHDDLTVHKLRLSGFKPFCSAVLDEMLSCVDRYSTRSWTRRFPDALRRLEVDLLCTARKNAYDLLARRRAVLRVRRLFIGGADGEYWDDDGVLLAPRTQFWSSSYEDAADLTAAELAPFASAFAAHEPLTELHMLERSALDAGALTLLVDVALTRHLRALTLCFRHFDGAGAALARLLSDGNCLQELTIGGSGAALFAPDEDVAALCAAVRASRVLTLLRFANVGLWENPTAAAALLGACTSHPTLHTLSISHCRVPSEHRSALGAALGALVAADAPALKRLDVSDAALEADGLLPLLEALALNTQLADLCCARNFDDAAEASAFCCATLQPAVLASSSLRKLDICTCLCDAANVMAARFNVPQPFGGLPYRQYLRKCSVPCQLKAPEPREPGYASGYESF